MTRRAKLAPVGSSIERRGGGPRPRRRGLWLASLMVVASFAPVAEAQSSSVGDGGGAATEAELPESGDAAPMPTSIGPFVLRTADGAFSFRPTFAAQLRLTATDREQGDARRAAAAFDLQRLRVGARVEVTEWTQAQVQLELSPRGPELIDAWAEVRLADAARLRVGQQKLPFTRYFAQSMLAFALVDWPLTSRVFGGEHQIGAMVHDTDREGAELDYAVGVFGGENRRSAHARELPPLYGERHGNPSRLADMRAPTAPHPELVLSVTHRSSRVPSRSNMPSTVVGAPSGALQHAVGVSAAWDVAPERGRDFALRIAPELRLEAGGVSVTTVGYAGLVPTAAASMEPGMLGVLLEVAVRVHRHLELAVRVARVAVLRALREDAAAYASSQQPDDPEALAAWASQYEDAGRVSAWQEVAVGINVPIFGRSLIWQNDLAWLRTEGADGPADDLRARSQLQLAI